MSHLAKELPTDPQQDSDGGNNERHTNDSLDRLFVHASNDIMRSRAAARPL